MAFVAALVRDPAADAARLAEVLDTKLVTYARDDGTDAPWCALDLGDCLLALYPVPSDDAASQRVWGGSYDRPRCIALGLLVEELQRVGTIENVRRLCDGARVAGARVVHCTAVARPDGAGSTENCKIFAMSARQRREHGQTSTQIGTPGAEVIDGLADPRDI